MGWLAGVMLGDVWHHSPNPTLTKQAPIPINSLIGEKDVGISV